METTVHELHTVDVLLAGLYLTFEVSSLSEAAADGCVLFNNYKNLLGQIFECQGSGAPTNTCKTESGTYSETQCGGYC